MNITGIGHVGIQCNDFAKTFDFYTKGLGGEKAFELINDDGVPYITYIAIPGGQFVELFHMNYTGDNKPQKCSFVHICLEVEDFAKAVRQLQANGVKVTTGGAGSQLLEEPFEKRTPGQCGSLCAFVTDPEGNDVELMQFTENSKQIKGGEFHV